MANVDGVVTDADVRAAQTLLDSLQEATKDQPLYADPGDLLAARSFLAGVMADVRTAGYLEGLQEGRRQTAHLVRDALDGEGL